MQCIYISKIRDFMRENKRQQPIPKNYLQVVRLDARRIGSFRDEAGKKIGMSSRQYDRFDYRHYYASKVFERELKCLNFHSLSSKKKFDTLQELLIQRIAELSNMRYLLNSIKDVDDSTDG